MRDSLVQISLGLFCGGVALLAGGGLTPYEQYHYLGSVFHGSCWVLLASPEFTDYMQCCMENTRCHLGHLPSSRLLTE